MFFPLFMPKSESLPSLFRPSLPLLFTKEQPWTICSFSWAHKKEWFAQKTDDQIPNPGIITTFWMFYAL